MNNTPPPWESTGTIVYKPGVDGLVICEMSTPHPRPIDGHHLVEHIRAGYNLSRDELNLVTANMRLIKLAPELARFTRRVSYSAILPPSGAEGKQWLLDKLWNEAQSLVDRLEPIE